ncbi:PREDICTED: uncharacterized protein LOC109214279 [Nicotiana attenuata]|uniref:uncharacterized protein LOC109214279 n=1 Tax=Nicotiana attenuata TaxID=49451 RepID=UPI0009050363|nr:PREDICTED: uncharacterized protein LOC109214279 [Nicotiana attenuata]
MGIQELIGRENLIGKYSVASPALILGIHIPSSKKGHERHCWLIMRQRLLTMDRLHMMGVSQERTCLLCGMQDETVHHLYFECHFSRRCIDELCSWWGIKLKQPDMQSNWRKIGRCIKGRICRGFVTSIIATIMYGIWRARNEALWNQKVPMPTKMWKSIKEDNKYRLQLIEANRKNRKIEWINHLYR